MSRRVVVSGFGVVSALGPDVDTFWSGLLQGRSGMGLLARVGLESLRVRIGYQVPGFVPEDHFAAELLPQLDPHSQFALLAARQAVADAGLEATDLVAAAAVVGTGCGGKMTDEETYQRLYQQGRPRVHPLTIPRGMPSAAASQVSMQLGVQGPVFTVASACASAAHAVCQAAVMVRTGLVDLALAGGADAPFSFGLLKAWEAMRVLSPDGCRPFSRDRNGLVLGEGAGMVVLESESHARARGAQIYAELAGCGMSADAGHITAPAVEGAARAMRAALMDAGLQPQEIDYVNAHGTGTQLNDVSETRALHLVFGAHAPRLAVSSSKSMHGHSLGASGAMELVATALALRHGVAPPTANFSQPGEGCDLDYLPNQARPMEIRAALSNSFAFGGLNAVLALRRVVV